MTNETIRIDTAFFCAGCKTVLVYLSSRDVAISRISAKPYVEFNVVTIRNDVEPWLWPCCSVRACLMTLCSDQRCGTCLGIVFSEKCSMAARRSRDLERKSGTGRTGSSTGDLRSLRVMIHPVYNYLGLCDLE